MTENQLAHRLRKTYQNAAFGGKVTSVQLFSLAYSAQISQHSVKGLVGKAGLPKGYISEIYRGMRLSKYFKLKRHITI